MMSMNYGIMCQPGDVVLLPFPSSDHSTSKKRPVIVLKEPDQRGDFACLAVTSSFYQKGSFVLSGEHFATGVLPRLSWVRISKVYTVNRSLIAGVFGSIYPHIF